MKGRNEFSCKTAAEIVEKFPDLEYGCPYI
jgi:hypothetical protein